MEIAVGADEDEDVPEDVEGDSEGDEKVETEG